MRFPCSLLTSLLVGLCATTAPAQTSGFKPGEILLYNPFVHGTGFDDGAILRLDPQTGQVAVVLHLNRSLYRPGAMCFDAFRGRVLFFGDPESSGTQFMRLYELDGNGNATDLGFESENLHVFAPGAGGKVYFHDEASGPIFSPLRYLDASNVRHDLLDAGGAAPYDAPALHWIAALAYDPGLHALLAAIRSDIGITACPGGSDSNLTVVRLDLSADGSRVLSTSCAQAAPDPLGANRPVGWSRLPDGDWLLAVDTNSNASQARLLRVDPASLAVSAFAFNGPYSGAAITDAACYSTLRGEALLLDDCNGRLVSHAELGGSTIVATSMPMTFPGYYGFDATMIEVPDASNGNTVGFYCTAKTTSSGCTPTLSVLGAPSASAGSGFTLTASSVEPNKNGLLFYSTLGANGVAFQGGHLCVKAPIKRTAVVNSQGASACSGALSTDFNQWVAAGGNAALIPAARVWSQFWFRDPAHPIAGTGLSAGATFTLGP